MSGGIKKEVREIQKRNNLPVKQESVIRMERIERLEQKNQQRQVWSCMCSICASLGTMITLVLVILVARYDPLTDNADKLRTMIIETMTNITSVMTNVRDIHTPPPPPIIHDPGPKERLWLLKNCFPQSIVGRNGSQYVDWSQSETVYSDQEEFQIASEDPSVLLLPTAEEFLRFELEFMAYFQQDYSGTLRSVFVEHKFFEQIPCNAFVHPKRDVPTMVRVRCMLIISDEPPPPEQPEPEKYIVNSFGKRVLRTPTPVKEQLQNMYKMKYLSDRFFRIRVYHDLQENAVLQLNPESLADSGVQLWCAQLFLRIIP